MEKRPRRGKLREAEKGANRFEESIISLFRIEVPNSRASHDQHDAFHFIQAAYT